MSYCKSTNFGSYLIWRLLVYAVYDQHHLRMLVATNISENTQFAKYNSTPKFADLQYTASYSFNSQITRSDTKSHNDIKWAFGHVWVDIFTLSPPKVSSQYRQNVAYSKDAVIPKSYFSNSVYISQL